MKSSFVIPLFERFAEEKGMRIRIEPSYRFVAQLTLPNGQKKYVSTHIDGINGAGATEIARDKTYALYFLQQMGYSVPEGRAFFSQGYADFLGSDKNAQAAWSYAESLGFPVIVKPNGKNQGRGVWNIHSREEFDAAMQDQHWVDIYRVERYCPGRDYRIVVYRDKCICAYERIPLSVLGDGSSTVRTLVEKKNDSFLQQHRSLEIDPTDRRMQWSLKRNALSFDSVLESGRVLMLLGNANLSSGGDARDVTESIHSAYIECAIKCAHDMGLRLCGLDMLIDGDAREEHQYTILEVNAGPGLAHYASLGEVQMQRVENLYRSIFDEIITSAQ